MCKKFNVPLAITFVIIISVSDDNWMNKIAQLLNEGGSVNAYLGNFTPLLWAIRYGDREYVRCLISMGADVNLVSKGGASPLFKSLEQGRNTGITQLLVESGADCNKEFFTGDTALIDAIDNGLDDVAQHLIRHGADVNHYSSNSETALFHAVGDGTRDEVRFLLKAGANPNIPDKYNGMPINVAISNGWLDCANMLLSANAEINVPSFDGSGTPLTISAFVGMPEMTQKVLQRNARVNIIEEGPFEPGFGYHQDWCVPPCYIYLYVAGEKLKYFESLEFITDFIDLECEWFLTQILLPSEISKDPLKTHITNFVHIYEEKQNKVVQWVRPRVQNDRDIEKNLQFFTKIHESNFSLKTICRKSVRKLLLQHDTHENLFNRIPKLQIPKELGQYLLYDVNLDDDFNDWQYIKLQAQYK